MKARLFVLLMMACCLTTSFAFVGCKKQTAADSDRQSRLVADENYRLKIQLKQLSDQLARCAKDANECKRENARVQKESEESANFLMTQWREETEQLQKQVESLAKQNGQLKSQLQQQKGGPLPLKE